MTTVFGNNWGAVLSAATASMALLSIIWFLSDIATKADQYKTDRYARMTLSVGLLLMGYAGMQGTSPVRTLPGAIGISLMVASSLWMTLQMRKRAGEE